MQQRLDQIEAALNQAQLVTSDEPGRRAAVPLARYRMGRITVDQLQTELLSLGYQGVELDRLLASAPMDRDRWQEERRLTVLRAALRRGDMTRSGFILALSAAGWDGAAAAELADIELAAPQETTARASSIGLVVETLGGESIVPTALRQSTIGLVLQTPLGQPVTAEVLTRASAIGLMVQGPLGEPIGETVHRHSSVGLGVETVLGEFVVEVEARPASVGLVIETASGEPVAHSEQRESSIGVVIETVLGEFVA